MKRDITAWSCCDHDADARGTSEPRPDMQPSPQLGPDSATEHRGRARQALILERAALAAEFDVVDRRIRRIQQKKLRPLARPRSDVVHSGEVSLLALRGGSSAHLPAPTIELAVEANTLVPGKTHRLASSQSLPALRSPDTISATKIETMLDALSPSPGASPSAHATTSRPSPVLSRRATRARAPPPLPVPPAQAAPGLEVQPLIGVAHKWAYRPPNREPLHRPRPPTVLAPLAENAWPPAPISDIDLSCWPPVAATWRSESASEYIGKPYLQSRNQMVHGLPCFYAPDVPRAQNLVLCRKVGPD